MKRFPVLDLVGLGGAEFRLPELLGVFRFRPPRLSHSEQADEHDRGGGRVTIPDALRVCATMELLGVIAGAAMPGGCVIRYFSRSS